MVACTLSNTGSSEPSGSDASRIPAVADAMSCLSTLRPSVRNKARLWFLQSQTLRANRDGTSPLSTADRSGARNALTAQGGGSGHVASPTLSRQYGNRVTGNCRSFLAVGGEQSTATDSDVRLHAIERNRRVAGRTLAALASGMTETGLPAVNEQMHRQGSSAAALNVPSALRRFIRQPSVRRKILCRAATRRTAGIRAISERCPPVSPQCGLALSTEQSDRQPSSGFLIAQRRGRCHGDFSVRGHNLDTAPMADLPPHWLVNCRAGNGVGKL